MCRHRFGQELPQSKARDPLGDDHELVVRIGAHHVEHVGEPSIRDVGRRDGRLLQV
jgi:hypothetical protein